MSPTSAVLDIVPSSSDSSLSGEGICGASGILATSISSVVCGFGVSALLFWLAAEAGLACGEAEAKRISLKNSH